MVSFSCLIQHRAWPVIITHGPAACHVIKVVTWDIVVRLLSSLPVIGTEPSQSVTRDQVMNQTKCCLSAPSCR